MSGGIVLGMTWLEFYFLACKRQILFYNRDIFFLLSPIFLIIHTSHKIKFVCSRNINIHASAYYFCCFNIKLSSP